MIEKTFNNAESSKVPPSEGFREAYILHLADNALILGHRNSEWCGHGPVLEQDIAITNISLDLIGQARNFYQYGATLIKQSTDQLVNPASEDTLAYLRDAHEFKNCLLVELPIGDWAQTILRQFFFSTYQFYLYQQLQNSKDEQLAAIATKALKEVTYHLRWSSEWVIRLGDGTKESHDRITKAIDELWNYTGELFLPTNYELLAEDAGIGVDISVVKTKWHEKVNEVFSEATLIVPPNVQIQTRGKEGKHSEHLDKILGELQFMQRTYPDSEW
jgi:ring-1,2-phenylacetyl-CoA epoxidase subunit PaaC